MRRTVLFISLAFALTLVVAGAALVATRACPGDCRGTSGDDRLLGSARENTI